MHKISRRVIATVLTLVMVMGNFVFNATTVAARPDQTLNTLVGEIAVNDGDHVLKTLGELVQPGASLSDYDPIGQIGFSYSSFMGAPGNPALGKAGEEVFFVLSASLSGLQVDDLITDTHIAVTIPDGMDVTSVKSSLFFQLGRFGDQVVLLFDLSNVMAVGDSIVITWSGKHAAEAEESLAEYTSRAFIAALTKSGENAEDDVVIHKSGDASYTLTADSAFVLSKSVDGGIQQVARQENGQFVGYSYVVTYKVDVDRVSPDTVNDTNPTLQDANAMGILRVRSMELTDKVPLDAGGASPISIDTNGRGQVNGTTITWNLTEDDFEYVNSVYKLKSPLTYQVAYDAETFLVDNIEEISKMTNEIQAKVIFMDGTEKLTPVAKAVVTPLEKGKLKPGLTVTKTTNPAGAPAVVYADPEHKVLDLPYLLSIRNTGNTVLDKATVEDAKVSITDEGGTQKAASAGTDFIYKNVVLQKVDNSVNFASVDVYAKTSDGNGEYTLVQTIDYNTLKSNAVTVAPKTGETWVGVKLVVHDFQPKAGDSEPTPTIVAQVNLAYDGKGKVFDQSGQLLDTAVRKMTNTAEYAYTYTGKETSVDETSATWDINYTTFNSATLTKASISGEIERQALREGSEAKYKLTFTNTTGYDLDALTLTDMGLQTEPNGSSFAYNIKALDVVYTTKTGAVTTIKAFYIDANNGNLIKDGALNGILFVDGKDIKDVTKDDILKAQAFVLKPDKNRIENGAKIEITITADVKEPSSETVTGIVNTAKAVYEYSGVKKQLDAQATIPVVTKANGEVAKAIKSQSNGTIHSGNVTSEMQAVTADSTDGLWIKDQSITYTMTLRNTGSEVFTAVNFKDTGLTFFDKNSNNQEVKRTLTPEQLAALVSVDSVQYQVGSGTLQTVPDRDKAKILTEGVSLRGVTVNPGETLTVTVKLTLKQVAMDGAYVKFTNTADFTFVSASHLDGRTLTTNSVATTVNWTKPTFTATKTADKGTETINDLALLKNKNYYIYGYLNTSIALSKVTITDLGMQFTKDDGSALTLPDGKTVMDYAWINSFTIPQSFINTMRNGGAGSIYVEYMLNPQAAWTKDTAELISVTNGYTFTLGNTPVYSVRVVIEHLSAGQYDMATVSEPFIVNAGFKDLAELGKQVGTFKMKNQAEIGWWFGNGTGGTGGGGTAVVDGSVITAVPTSPNVTDAKAVNTINGTTVNTGNKYVTYKELLNPTNSINNQFNYTITATNGTTGKPSVALDTLRIYEDGLEWSYETDNKPVTNYSFDPASINVVLDRAYDGTVTLYAGGNAYTMVKAASSNTYTLSAGDQVAFGALGAKTLYVELSGAKVPAYMVAKLNLTAVIPVVIRDGNLTITAKSLRNKGNVSYTHESVAGEQKIGEQTADVEIRATNAVTADKSAKVEGSQAFVKNGQNIGENINLSDVLTGTAITYKLTGTNTGDYTGEMQFTDKPQAMRGSAVDTTVMTFVKVWVPASEIRRLIPCGGADVSTGETQLINGVEYKAYKAQSNNDVYDKPMLKFKDVIPGEIITVYAEYAVLDTKDFDQTKLITSLVNNLTVKLTPNIEGVADKDANSFVTNPVVNDQVSYLDTDLSKKVQNLATEGGNAVMNLSSIMNQYKEVDFVISHIGHADGSTGSFRSFTLEDFGISIKNVLTGQDITGNDVTEYAYINKISAGGHGVKGLTLTVTAKLKDGTGVKADWDQTEGFTISTKYASQAIISFEVKGENVPAAFKNASITVTTLVKQAQKTEFYGWDAEKGQFIDSNAPLFTITNTAKVTAHNGYATLEKSAHDFFTVLSSSMPEISVIKSAKPESLGKMTWFVTDPSDAGRKDNNLIVYTFDGIRNQAGATIDEVRVKDTNMQIIGDNPAGLGFQFESLRVKLITSGANDLQLKQLQGAADFQIGARFMYMDDQGTAKFTDVVYDTEAFLLNGEFNATLPADKVITGFEIVIINMPPQMNVSAELGVRLDLPSQWNELADIDKIQNQAEVYYRFGAVEKSRAMSMVDTQIVAADQQMELFKTVEQAEAKAGDVITWDVYLINVKPDDAAKSFTSAVLNPVIVDLIPAIFNDPSKFSYVIDYGKISDMKALSVGNIASRYTKDASVGLTVLPDDVLNENDKTATWAFEGKLWYGEAIHIQITNKLPSKVVPGQFTNVAKAHSDSVKHDNEASASTVINITDQVQLTKESHGSRSGDNYFISPSTALAMPGDTEGNYFRLTVYNFNTKSTERPIQDIRVADTLPAVGDTGTTLVSQRGTEWKPVYPVGVSKLLSNFAVYGFNQDTWEWVKDEEHDAPMPNVYVAKSMSTSEMQTALKTPEAELTLNGWIKADEDTDFNEYGHIIIVFPADFELLDNTRVQFHMNFSIPEWDSQIWDTFDQKLAANENATFIAWNSAAVIYKASGIQGYAEIAEPLKAGINVVYSAIGDRVWEDKTGDGLQLLDDDGAYLDKGVKGVNVYLFKAELQSDGTYVVSQEPFAQTTTDDNGLYRFDRIPNGYYVIGFEKQDRFDFTVENSDDGLEAINSDVWNGQPDERIITYNGQTIYLTQMITLGNIDINKPINRVVDLSWDAGIVLRKGTITVTKSLLNYNGQAIDFGNKEFTIRLRSVDESGEPDGAVDLRAVVKKGQATAVFSVPHGYYLITEEGQGDDYTVRIDNDGRVTIGKGEEEKGIKVENREKLTPPSSEPPTSEPPSSELPSVRPSAPITTIITTNPPAGASTPRPTTDSDRVEIGDEYIPAGPITPPPTEEEYEDIDDMVPMGPMDPAQTETPEHKENPKTGDNRMSQYNLIIFLGIGLCAVLEIRDFYGKRRKVS